MSRGRDETYGFCVVLHVGGGGARLGSWLSCLIPARAMLGLLLIVPRSQFSRWTSMIPKASWNNRHHYLNLPKPSDFPRLSWCCSFTWWGLLKLLSRGKVFLKILKKMEKKINTHWRCLGIIFTMHYIVNYIYWS